MKETRHGEVIEIDLKKLFLTYLHRFWLIILCTLVVGSSVLLYSVLFITPLYQASITVYVNNVRSGERIDYISGSNLQASQQLVNTYSNIIRSNTVLEKVIETAKVEYTPDDMRRLLSTSQVDETELFNVYITHPDPEMAAYIANAIAEVAPAEIEGFVEGSSAKIIDYAKTPENRSYPSYSRNALIGALIGAALAIIYITLRYMFDVRVKDENDLKDIADIPVLGQIPGFEYTSSGKMSCYASPYGCEHGKKEA